MMAPPTNSLAANCQPMSTTSTMPSSMTRLVEANMKTVAATKSAPLHEERLGHGRGGVRARRRHHAVARGPGDRLRVAAGPALPASTRG